MVKKQIATGLGLALAIFAGTAAAQLRPQYQFPEVVRDPSGPAAVQLGGAPVYMTPTASLQAGHDSNVTQVKDGGRDSPVQIWGANAVLDAQSNRSVYLGDLYVNRGVYSNSSQDNYTDWGTRNSYDIEFTPRNYLHVNWDYIQGHEGRGTTDRPDQPTPDVYRLNTQGAVYAYGAPGAQGRIELYGSRAERRYNNNRDITQFSDRNVSEFGGVFYWRAMPKTYALVEARQTQIRYITPGPRLSGDEDRFFVGGTWEATAATNGTVKIGEFQKKFDNGQPTYRAPAWEAQLDWSPRSYTNFSFYTVKTPVESTGLGNFIIAEIAGVVWNHTWNQRFNTSLALQYQRSIYQGFDRSDDNKLVDFKANYQMRRWLGFGAEWIYSNRNSNFDAVDYSRNIWLLSANISM